MKMIRSFSSREIDVVGALAAVGLLDHHRDEVVHVGVDGIAHGSPRHVTVGAAGANRRRVAQEPRTHLATQASQIWRRCAGDKTADVVGGRRPQNAARSELARVRSTCRQPRCHRASDLALAKPRASGSAAGFRPRRPCRAPRARPACRSPWPARAGSRPPCPRRSARAGSPAPAGSCGSSPRPPARGRGTGGRARRSRGVSSSSVTLMLLLLADLGKHQAEPHPPLGDGAVFRAAPSPRSCPRRRRCGPAP